MTGFINVIKPTGINSTRAVSLIKKLAHQKKVGHLGTLDPAAAGVLPIAIGKATKFFNYFLNKDKVYYAVAEFGVMTTTLDSEGDITKIHDMNITKNNIESVIHEFCGQIEQIPPLYSALKINGVPAYKLARKGEDVEIPKRKINIYSFDLIEEIGDNIFSFRVHCQAGTYIRTLLSDLAKKLGTVANIPVIIREKSGPFDMVNASTIGDIKENITNQIISIEDVLPNLPRINILPKHEKKVLNGVKFSANDYKLDGVNEFLGYLDGKLFGLFQAVDNEIKCKINLYEEETNG